MKHRKWMAEALAQARQGARAGEVPVGAVVVRNGAVLAAAHNRREALCDPTAHAEILVLREAARQLGDWRLADCSLYVTLEPCAMCASAIAQARIPVLVYGASDPERGAVDSGCRPADGRGELSPVTVYGGICEQECGVLLEEFFAARRPAAHHNEEA